MRETEARFEFPDGQISMSITLHTAKGDVVITADDAFSLAELRSTIAAHEAEQRHHYGGTLAQRLDGLIERYRDGAIRQLRSVKRFRDEMVLQLQAMKIVADMVAAGQTHREKDARLRGMIEVIGGAISKISKIRLEIEDHDSFAYVDDVFRSDYPTRELFRRIHELERELAEHRKRDAAVTGDPAEDDVEF
jgi:hypothetical protein